MPTLESYGWTASREAAFAPHAASGLVPGRVLEEERDGLAVATRGGELRAVVAGALRHHADGVGALPAVGDFVGLDAPGGGRARVRVVLPRSSLLTRKEGSERSSAAQVVAANVDLAFLVASVDRDFSARRIERTLAVLWESGARPVVLVSKVDVAEDPVALVAEAVAAAPGADVLPVSAATGEGVAAVASLLLPGTTAILVGSSGAGKSTLLNRLLGEERQSTAPVRDHDGQGRHTTTRRSLFLLPGGGALIDTPGIREIASAGGGEGLDLAFADLALIARECRFGDCRHAGEPGCAVRAAVESGALPGERLEAWHRLERERAHWERQGDARLMKEARRRWKVISRSVDRDLRRRGRR